MKRLLAFLFFALTLCSLTLKPSPKIFDCPWLSEVCIVSYSKIDDAERVIESGEEFYNYFASDFDRLASSAADANAIILYLDSQNFDSATSFLKISYFEGQSIDGKQVFYGFSPLYNKSFVQNGKKVNAQMVIDGQRLMIGFPTICVGF